MPPWFRIVSEYPDFHNGPTVPFLLGALQKPVGAKFRKEASAKAALRQLLERVAEESGEEYGVRLFDCPNIKELVFTENGFADCFDWDPIDGRVPPDLDSLVEALWTRYGEPIMDGTYSIEHRVWREFSDEEKETIEDLLSE